MQATAITLKELLLKIKAVVNQSFDQTYWVSADISDFHEDVNRGHCYLELVQKKDDKLIEAKIRATIWANTYSLLKSYFLHETGQPLRTGMKVLVEVAITFHELYGMTCVIQDIDPTFTLGDIQRKKQETIKQLKEDGVWDMNKEVTMPDLIQRIAVISSASAAGYGDFCHQLQSNKEGFYFSFQLFPAIMQGEDAAQSIIKALDKIFEEKDNYDAVVIIRGGGASTDLLAFDEYDLAYTITQFPLPIITGIGHERDESVCDMVAHTRCKTPTAVAAFLYERMLNVEQNLLSMENSFSSGIEALLEKEQNKLTDYTASLIRNCTYRLNLEHQKKKKKKTQITNGFQKVIDHHRHHTELLENTLQHISPENILRKGFTITLSNGKIVKDSRQVKEGDVLRTITANGELNSIVRSPIKEKNLTK